MCKCQQPLAELSLRHPSPSERPHPPLLAAPPLLRPHLSHGGHCPSVLGQGPEFPEGGARALLAACPSCTPETRSGSRHEPHPRRGPGAVSPAPAYSASENLLETRPPRASPDPASRQLVATGPFFSRPESTSRGRCQLLAPPTSDRVPGATRWPRRGAFGGRAHSPRR